VESLNDGSTHRVTVESLGLNVESNWTHVPHGYKNEPEMIKELMNRVAKQEADKKEKVNKKVKHLGGGVVLIEDLLDADTIDSIDFSLIEASIIPSGYTQIDGEDYMEGGYHVPKEDMPTMPVRYYENAHNIDLYRLLEEAAYCAALEYCKIFPSAVENITSIAAKHFVKYLPGNFMGVHSDCTLSYKNGTAEPSSIAAIGTTVSMSIILNDKFAGGEMAFRIPGISISPKAGSAIIYPSNYMGAHEVLRVTSGVRWVFLAFLYHGDKSFTINPEMERYAERYEWTMNFRKVVRDFFKKNDENNLNMCQQKVL
jgi:hypothetical protein